MNPVQKEKTLMLTPEERLALEEEDKYWFEELFYRDVESWFSSDIACCDVCYDDFLECWPHAYSADEAEFQRSGIDLSCFYSGSRLRDIYTEEEFFKFLRLLSCPRCGSELKYNIWPYNFPFNVVSDFDKKLEEISRISQKTPFLLLKHDFSRDVYEAISALANDTESANIEESLYRARAIDHSRSLNPSQFDFPPSKVVSEGRYNHAGVPVLYLGSSPATCFYEMREAECYIAEITIKEKIKILDLANVDDSHLDRFDLLSTLVYSALISAKQDNHGWHKPKYVFSRFISDCARSSGFDAIKYPSTRSEEKCFNLVVLDERLSLGKGSELIRTFKYV